MALRLLSRNATLLGGAQRGLASIAGGKPSRQVLQEMPSTEVTELTNGLRVASEDNGSATCTIGVWTKAGSRYDGASLGTAYFMEHLMYRGTGKRSRSKLEEELASMGAVMSSKTGREHACVYVKCRPQNVDNVVELLADVVNNGAFDEKTIEGEKEMILREQEEAESDKRRVVMDYLHETAYQKTPLAHCVLGTSAHVFEMTADQLKLFHRDNYQGHRMALVGAGGVSHDKLVTLGEKHFGKQPNGESAMSALGTRFTGGELLYRDDSMPGLFSSFAVETVGCTHADSLTLSLAAMLVGSWDRTHGCHQSSPNRLARDMATGIPSLLNYHTFFCSYEDTGLFGVYGVLKDGADHLDFTSLITEELKAICMSASDTDALRGRNMLKTKLFADLGSNVDVAKEIGRQILTIGQRLPLLDVVDRIDAITADTLKDVVMRHVYDRDIAVAAIGETEGHTDYMVFRPRMSHWRL